MDILTGTVSGSSDGPVSPDAWKRAVYRAAPSCFGIEMLPPTKQGNNFSFGMRIWPVRDDTCSMSSRGSFGHEYVIWRRWDDCLAFQETLEKEYQRMARAKRQRLAAGKGVKKNGIYIHDRASSWESLPPGPDPKSVAPNVHDYLPKLTKKGTIFRASQATIEQRQKELTALVEALWEEDVPALIKELRENRLITDFFGYWRRDHDLVMKEQSRAEKFSMRSPRGSIASSISTSYSTTTVNSVCESQGSYTRFLTRSPSPASRRRRLLDLPDIARPHSSYSSEAPHPSPHLPSSAPPEYRTMLSSRPRTADSERRSRSSHSPLASSFITSDDLSTRDSTRTSTTLVMSEDVPIIFSSEDLPEDGHISPLAPLPEDQELKTPLPGMTFIMEDVEDDIPHPVRKPRRNIPSEVGSHRSVQIYKGLSIVPGQDETYPVEDAQFANANRFSTASITPSVISMLNGLDIALPSDEFDQPRGRARESIASFMTTDSADAIIPLSPPRKTQLRRSMSASAKSSSCSTLTPGDDVWSDDEHADAHFYATAHNISMSYSPDSPESESRPETPLGPAGPQPSNTKRPTRPSRPSTAQSTSSGSSIDSSTSPLHSGHTIAVKATHNKAIIILRVPREISFNEMRKKLYEKFVRQEGIPLSESFTMAYMLPPTIIQSDHVDPARARSRSNSLSSMWSVRTTNLAPMRLVTSQVEWELILASVKESKLTIRILDSSS